MAGKSKAIGEELYNQCKLELKKYGIRGEIHFHDKGAGEACQGSFLFLFPIKVCYKIMQEV